MTGEGSHTLQYRSLDNNGNTEAATAPLGFQIDTVAPSVSASVTPSPVGGYYVHPTVTITASDAGSGVALVESNVDGAGWTAYTAPFAVTGDGAHTVQFRATDTAGNVKADSVSFNVDATAPTTTASAPCSNAGSNGWCLVPVAGHAHGDRRDLGRRVDEVHDRRRLAADLHGAVHDLGGRLAHGAVLVRPTTPGTRRRRTRSRSRSTRTTRSRPRRSRPAIHNGWYASPTLTLTGARRHGLRHRAHRLRARRRRVDTYAGPLSGFSTGNHFVQYRSTDNAGRRGDATKLIAFKVDAVKPTVNITTPADGEVYPLDKVVTAKFKCTDNESGIDTCVGSDGERRRTSTPRRSGRTRSR